MNTPDDAPEWLKMAMLKMREAGHFKLGAKGLALASGRSLEHVGRLTRKHYDKSPSEIANEQRMEFARKQLLMTSFSVTQISENCGFSNTSQFYNLFRKRFGESPRTYRKTRKR
jgi:AraC family cel operon transcriptional repressor